MADFRETMERNPATVTPCLPRWSGARAPRSEDRRRGAAAADILVSAGRRHPDPRPPPTAASGPTSIRDAAATMVHGRDGRHAAPAVPGCQPTLRPGRRRTAALTRSMPAARSPRQCPTIHPGFDAADAYARRWPALFMLLLAGFMNLIDITIVNVALPRLQASLGATQHRDRMGGRRLCACLRARSLAVRPPRRLIGRQQHVPRRRRRCFTLFSAFCGLAPTMDDADRRARAAGPCRRDDDAAGAGHHAGDLPAAGTRPCLLAVRPVAGLASVAGPLAGGLLIGADLFGLDWRPIFLVNIPVGILAVIAGWLLIPRMPRQSQPEASISAASVIAGLSIFAADLSADRGPQLWLAGLDLRHDRCCSVGVIVFYFYERAPRAPARKRSCCRST